MMTADAKASRSVGASQVDDTDSDIEEPDPRRWRVWLKFTAASFGLALLCFVLINATSPRFFFRDDAVNESIGFYMQMGQLWIHGHLPIITDGSMWGSYVYSDTVKSPFAPQVIAASITLATSYSVPLTVAVFSVLTLAITVVGYSWLAHELGVARRWILWVGVVAATQPVALYYFNASWWNLATAWSWFGFAAAAFHRALRVRRPWPGVVAVLAAACLFASAGTQMHVAYMFFCAATSIIFLLDRRDWRTFTQISLLGVAILTLAVLPNLLEYFENSDLFRRPNFWGNDADFMSQPASWFWQTLLPVGGDYFHTFGGERFVPMAIGFVSPLLALLFFYRATLPKPGDRTFRVLVSMSVFALVAALGPTNTGPVRWPLRYLPVVGAFLTILFARLILNKPVRADRRWARPLFGLYLFVAIVQFVSNAPESFLLGKFAGIDTVKWLVGLALSAVLATVCVPLFRRAGGRAKERVAMASQFVALILMVFALPNLTAAGFGNQYASPVTQDVYEHNRELVGRRVAFGDLDNRQRNGDRNNYARTASGLIGLYGIRSINGYSPVGHTGFEEYFPVRSAHGYFKADQVVNNVTHVPEEFPDAYVYQLFGIRELIGTRNEMTPELIDQLERAGLQRVPLDDPLLYKYEPVAERKPKYQSVGYVTEGTSLTEVDTSNPRRLEYDVSTGPGGGSIVLSRVWWPAYWAQLDGADVPVHPYNDALVQVEVPPNTSGRLVVRFTPTSWHTLKNTTVIGLLAVVGLFLLGRRRHGSQESPDDVDGDDRYPDEAADESASDELPSDGSSDESTDEVDQSRAATAR